jgi:CRP-like cAMP-binding protein
MGKIAEPNEIANVRGFVRSYQKTNVIFEEGQSGSEMYLIHSGRVELSLVKGKAKPVRVKVLKPGDFFGEMAMLDDYVRSATAVALDENTQLIVIDRSHFLFMIRQQPEFALSLMHILCQRIRDLNHQLGVGGVQL